MKLKANEVTIQLNINYQQVILPATLEVIQALQRAEAVASTWIGSDTVIYREDNPRIELKILASDMKILTRAEYETLLAEHKTKLAEAA